MARHKTSNNLGFLGVSIDKKIIEILKEKSKENYRGNVSHLVNDILSNFLKGKK